MGTNRHTLFYIKKINNKDLLYSTENYTQYLIITYKRICIYTHTHTHTHTYIRITCYTAETNTKL